jgi:hypothetical protein
MKSSNRTLFLSALVASLVPPTLVWASASPDLPPTQVRGDVAFVSGGSDPAQAAAMRGEAANYPLELDFLWGRGAKETPVADVEWSIRNPAGKLLLDASSGGPVVLASLPDGRYTITGHHDGKAISRVVAVHKGAHDDVLLEWPE